MIVRVLSVNVSEPRPAAGRAHRQKVGKQFEGLKLAPSNRAEFTARVEKYFKRRRDEIDGDV